MTAENTPSVRPLYAWEIQEARRVFGNQMRFEAIRVHECSSFPNDIDRLGSKLKRIPYTERNNAVTLGNHLYFPVKLLEALVPASHPEFYKMGWLIHELTHAWQYQQLGWRYLGMALQAQFRYGAKAYDFGGEEGLLKAFQEGSTLKSFNLEQQSDIARTYYETLVRGKDVSAWLPFVTELQQKIEVA